MGDGGRGDRPKVAGGRCPICKASTVHEFRPFCSRRCADVDLARWLSGSYAIAGGGADADEDGDEAVLPQAAAEPKQRLQ